MTYEFTHAKIRAERRALFQRLAISGMAAVVGFSVGWALHGVGDLPGALATAVLATVAAAATYAAQG